MVSNSLKFAALTTPHFIAIPVTIFLSNVIGISAYEIGVLIILGLIIGTFYSLVAYFGNRRKIMYLVSLTIAMSIPLAMGVQYIIQIAIEHDTVLIVVYPFIFAVMEACSYEILRMIRTEMT